MQVLDLTSCKALEVFPLVQVGAFPKLEKLCIAGSEQLKQLGATFAYRGTFPALTVKLDAWSLEANMIQYFLRCLNPYYCLNLVYIVSLCQ
jgi:hypothetical protein